MKEQNQSQETMNQMNEKQDYMMTLTEQMARYADMGQEMECKRDLSEATRVLEGFSQACMKSRDDMMSADIKFHQETMTGLNCITGTLCGLASNPNLTAAEHIAAENALAHMGDVYAKVDGARAKCASRDRIASGIFGMVATVLQAGMIFHKND